MFFPVAKLGLKLKLFVKNLYSSAQTHIAMKKNSAAPMSMAMTNFAINLK
jgi:hypothetical protein